MYELQSISEPPFDQTSSILTETKDVVTYADFQLLLRDTQGKYAKLYKEVYTVTASFFASYDNSTITAAFLRDSVYQIVYEGMHVLFHRSKKRKVFYVLMAQYMLLYLYEQYFGPQEENS